MHGACGRTRTYDAVSTTPDLQSGALATQPRMREDDLWFLVWGLQLIMQRPKT